MQFHFIPQDERRAALAKLVRALRGFGRTTRAIFVIPCQGQHRQPDDAVDGAQHKLHNHRFTGCPTFHISKVGDGVRQLARSNVSLTRVQSQLLEMHRPMQNDG